MSCHYYDPNLEYAKYVPKRKLETRWTEERVVILIGLYRQQSCLWNKFHSRYLNYYARRFAYEAIHEALDLPGAGIVEVIVQIRQVRKTYVDELRKMKEAQVNGARYDSIHVWFDQINDFLRDHLHSDELETVEKATKEFSYSSNYCDEEEGTNSSYTEDSFRNALNTASTTPSCCLALATATTTHKPCEGNDGVTRILEQRTEECTNRETCQGEKESEITRARGGSARVVFESKSIQPIKTNEGSTISQSSKDTYKMERISVLEFDEFARSVIYQLKQMRPIVAAKAQLKIQKILTSLAGCTESNISSEYSDIDSTTTITVGDLTLEGLCSELQGGKEIT